MYQTLPASMRVSRGPAADGRVFSGSVLDHSVLDHSVFGRTASTRALTPPSWASKPNADRVLRSVDAGTAKQARPPRGGPR
jgi:hypothetical protein